MSDFPLALIAAIASMAGAIIAAASAYLLNTLNKPAVKTA